ncbi:bifunctional heptose 7-phosphate kinase/heptose 1-phosphate adenyltransferase [Anaerosinus massiliensis]|uniref:bifunctional heptose 7-phosphate kinase/heptose 1-phosphate adenyltransferase n=1 Tax=Massilibacillus massiliensis TaxID=1806837 RepID=UPI000A8ADA6D|nr:PfkB family carbohydrate kinase [Massilibacillus massiliensis]
MKSDLVDVIHQIQGKKILVIGDMVADVYLHGMISRISREAPVLVLEQAKRTIVAGGAANVVHNVATLGGDVWAVGLVGNDQAGTGLRQIFSEKDIHIEGLLQLEDWATITKTRIIAGGAATVSQQIVRIDNEPKTSMSSVVEDKLMSFLESTLKNIDGVVMSDYGSGTLTEDIKKRIICYCKQHHIPCIVDSRYNILSFTGVDYVKQNDAEASANVGFAIENEELLLKAGAILLEKMQAKGILITRGDQGMTLFEASGAVHHIPVSNLSEVFDVSGAGDTCVAAMLLALAAGIEPVLAAEISNIAAGIAVRKLGTATVSAAELKNVIGEV